MGVVRLEITRREPVLDGAAYEKIEGVLRFTADPAARANEPIADLGLAPRNARGLVEYSADFYLLRPLDGGRRRLLLDVPNRGRKIALGMFNSTPRSNDPTSREDFGNQFLMRHGYTVAWIGWQPDVPRRDGMMAMTVPRVSGVSERVRCEFRPNARVDVLPLADRYHIPHPVARLDDPEAELHVREHADAPAVTLPRSAWRFPDAASVALDGGFQPGRIYDCYYRAQDPPVVGLGFTAVRDTASFLRWGTAAEGNPCAGADRAVVRVRRLAERPLPAAPALPGSRRGRGRPLRVGRGDPARGGSSARRVQLPLRPALAQRGARGRQPVPVHRRGAGRPGDRPARRAAPAPGRAREAAAHLHDQYLGRVLARRRLARAHRRRRHARRDPAGLRAPVPLRGEPAHAGRAAAARGGSQYRRPGLPPVQRGGLLAAPAGRAGQPRSLGERGRRAAAERGPAPGRRHRGGRRDDARASTRRFPARASPTTSSGRSGSTSDRRSSAGSSPRCRPSSARPT